MAPRRNRESEARSKAPSLHEDLLGARYYVPRVPGARVRESRRHVLDTGTEAWQVYVTKPSGVELNVIVCAYCAPAP
jgi:hypothetical protein